MIRVRRAEPTDCDALAPLFDAYRVFYERDGDVDAARRFLRARFDYGDSVIFLAEGDEGAPIGFTQLYPSWSSASLARIYVLNDLFVAPGARRSGAGRALLDAAHAFARAQGAVRVTLETAHDNHTAQRLYEATGYQRETHFFRYHWHVA